MVTSALFRITNWLKCCSRLLIKAKYLSWALELCVGFLTGHFEGFFCNFYNFGHFANLSAMIFNWITVRRHQAFRAHNGAKMLGKELLTVQIRECLIDPSLSGATWSLKRCGRLRHGMRVLNFSRACRAILHTIVFEAVNSLIGFGHCSLFDWINVRFHFNNDEL